MQVSDLLLQCRKYLCTIEIRECKYSQFDFYTKHRNWQFNSHIVQITSGSNKNYSFKIPEKSIVVIYTKFAIMTDVS